MFSPGYFAPGFLPQNYFPSGPILAAHRYFFHSYFAAQFFPDAYFPDDDVAGTPRYFYHGIFPLSVFPDVYFPGDVPVLEPEPEPQVIHVGRVGFPYRPIPSIRGRADLALPVLDFSAYGFTTPAEIRAVLDAELQAILALHATAKARAAHLTGALESRLPGLAVSADGHVHAPKPRATRTHTDDEEERLLLEHYMLTLTKGD